jgi:hypothetical protein
MESKITSEKNKREIIYPCLMIYEGSAHKIVVLANKEVDINNFGGTVLLSTLSSEYKIGEHYSHFSKEHFKVFEESIALNN